MFAPAVVAGWFSALFSCTTHTHIPALYTPPRIVEASCLGWSLTQGEAKTQGAIFAERGSAHFRAPTNTSGTTETQVFQGTKNCTNSLPLVTINVAASF
ncbi:uncharacterized protein CCOS01_07372 [Colletotrichum costaricense]|uniref:Secreted protein n=1 Tax=Colletotrichum costaricense TaxID=1209916 RepID=A0AAI9YXU1_9PEZI|nr:uncharacterized protein CCOS01_07372 [Colletotrichum costaricense]KAK1527110.1 hypothetical protein CCOS01_07372 [Colletotrichum costaricense]